MSQLPTNPHTVITDKDIDRLQTEIQYNRTEILKLQRRNALLAEQVRVITQKEQSTGRIKEHPDRDRNRARVRHRRQKRARGQRYPLRTWFYLAIVALSIAAICGGLGFAIAAKIAGK